MDMKKTVRKMSAILAGATMVGATVMGAMAYDLSDYPSPFLVDGHFVGKIVIGDKAQPSDTIGATDIIAALQAEAVTPVEGTSTGPTTSLEDGYKFSEADELVFLSGIDSVNAALDDVELPDLLKHGLVENEDNDEFEYDQELNILTGTLVNADVNNYDINDASTEPVLYYDLGTNAFYEVVVDFEDTWSVMDFQDSEDIELFGQMYTFDPDNAEDDDYLVLFGTDAQVYIEKGEKATVKYDGEDYTVEVIGGNSDYNNAIIRVGTETETVEEGESETIGGLPVFVKDVFISNVGDENVAVQLFIGSNKLELEWSDSADGEVKLNGQVLDEVVVNVDETTAGTNWDDVETLTFTVTPNDGEDELEYFMSGEDYVDPLFGSFKFYLAEVDDFTDGKEELNFIRSGELLQIEFTPEGGDAYTLDVLDAGVLAEDFLGNAELTNVEEDEIFIYNDDNDADAIVTHVLQISKITDGNDMTSTDFEVKVEDLTFGNTYTVSKCEAISNDIELYPVEGASVDEITFSTDDTCAVAAVDGELFLYTEAGAEVEIDSVTLAAHLLDPVADPVVEMYVDEDYQADAEETTPLADLQVDASWDAADDEEYDFSVSATGLDALDDNDDINYYLSEFGTYIVEEDDDSGAYVNMFVPAEEVIYDMWLAPVESTVVVSGSTGGSGAYTINPIPVGSSVVLDKDAMNLIGSTPLIVVGGPFVNTVAADLMGNPTTEQINTMFTEGRGKIKLYASRNALLVAGYSGMDTRGAAIALAEYSKHGLTGTEVEVVVPSLTGVSVITTN
ncbi:MAG: hypothetical protein ACP5N3_05700 [Candidatus Nanoarchaeia archaeon]